jgi:hypothetical protein
VTYDDAWRPAVPDWNPPGPGTYVYYLEVRYPPGAFEPGWRPDCWSDPAFLASLSRKGRKALAKQTFRWPREHLYLSASGAAKRAGTLRWFGAEVAVRRSVPVRWPVPGPETWIIDLKVPGTEWPGNPYPEEFDASGLPKT